MPEDIKQWIQERLFDHVPMAISVIDQNFKIVEANSAFRETYGEWEERLCYEVYKGRTKRCEDCGAAATFNDGKIRTREERGRDRDGKSVYYMVQLVPLIKRRDSSIPYIIEMCTDITRVKELERDKLVAERLAAVGQTVAGLAHGIKNIIMGLEGGMYVVNSGIKRNDEERAIKGWRMLENDIERISSFVKEFLEFAKGRTPKVVLVDLNEVAREVTSLFRERAKIEGVDLVEHLDEAVEPAYMDREGIHTCLTNLVLNAIDACLMSTKKDGRVVVTSLEETGTIVVEVSDTGVGMDSEIKRKVFTNFFSTKASGKGTGLGLLTTRKLVQEHGGTVSFDSVEGEGSTFRIEFPRNRLPEPPEDEETTT